MVLEKMRKIAFYHIYLTDHPGVWSSILMEQIKCMEDSDLLNELDELNITAVSQRDERVECFAEIFKTEIFRDTKVKVNLEFVENTCRNDQEMINDIQVNDGRNTVSENFTIRKLWNHCQKEDCHVLYFHAKGTTAVWRALAVRQYERFTNYFHGRQFSNWGVLTHWRQCVKALSKYDTAGVFLQREYPCYGANFFWANASYIRTLPNPAGTEWWYENKRRSKNEWVRNEASERFKEEQWTLSNPHARPYNLVELSPGDSPYLAYFPYERYKGKTFAGVE
jgi:hypothetical protein